MNAHSDPLRQLLANEHDGALDDLVATVAGTHQRCASDATKRGDHQTAEWHRLMASAAFDHLRRVSGQ